MNEIVEKGPSMDPILFLLNCLSVIVLVIILIVQFVWLNWRRVYLEKEPILAESWVELIGDPKFDPERGIYGTVLIGDATHRVVIQPKWWTFLSSELKRSEKEGACDGSPVSAVKTGQEPKFVVVLQNAFGETKGLGSRIRIGKKDILLTSYHVLECSDELFIAKYNVNENVGMRVALDPKWQKNFYCKDNEVDIVAIEVPSQVWSKLGVSIGSVKPATTTRRPICVYGASSSKAFRCSSGMGNLVHGFTGEHTASTTGGWSGSPIVSGGFIIGVHRGSNATKANVNRYTVMHPSFLHSPETMYDDGYVREIDDEEISARPYEFDEYYVHGRGVVKVAQAEYAVRKGVSPQLRKEFEQRREKFVRPEWVDEDDDAFFDTSAADFLSDVSFKWKGTEEGVPDVAPESHLNSSGAAAECSPPCESLEGISGKTPVSSETTECLSLSVAGRLSSLEKLVEQLLASMQLLQENVSQNSKNLIGLNVEAVRSLTPSSSKPQDSDPPKLPTDSKKVWKALPVTTPESSKDPVLEATGSQTGLKPRSRRSRRKRSAKTPPQESPSPV